MSLVYCILIGYFIGCINPAYILGRLKGKDVKKNGSGNAGASNALILFGKFAGVFCALFDIFKAYIAVYISEKLVGESVFGISTFVIASVFAIIGHIFPFYTGFKGGKGLASFGGMVLAYNPIIFLIMFMSAIVFVLLANYICFVPMLASVVFPVIYGIREKDVVGALILGIVAVVIFIKHIENLKRISKGTEFRISFLWNKNKELERLHITPDEEESVEETEAADEEPEHVNN